MADSPQDDDLTTSERRPDVQSQIQRRLQQLRSLRGIAPASRVPAIKSKAAWAINRTRRRAKTAPVRLVELGIGPRAANRAFWAVPGVQRSWFDINQHLGNLERRHPDSLPDFVSTTLSRTSNPMVFVGIAQRPFSADLLASWLTDELAHKRDALAQRVAASPMLGGGVIGAARLVLDREQTEQIEQLVLDAVTTLDLRMYEFASSTGYRPTQDDSTPLSPHNRHSRGCSHRAVVAEQLGDPEAYATLFRGADRVTVLATVETFGHFDVTPYLNWPDVGDVQVEHIRTRTPRFSQQYIDVHSATATLAETIVRNLGPCGELIEPSLLPVLAVEVADFLFFRALRLNAVERLLDDPTIDQVVVALDHHDLSSDFVRLLSGSARLRSEPRVEFVSASSSPSDRGRFIRTVDSIRHPVSQRRPSALRVDGWVVRASERQAARVAESMTWHEPGDRPVLLVVTANNSAYNDSTAAYIAELADEYDVRCLHIGRDASTLARCLQTSTPSAAATPIEFLVPPQPQEVSALAGSLHGYLFDHVDTATAHGRTGDDASAVQTAAWAAWTGLGRLCQDVLAPTIARLAAMHRWLASLDERGALPAAVLATPQRTPMVHALGPLSRHFGVPSITLEPHAQDANYSRYIKISTDYYGVMSDYFRDGTATGFGMPIERIRSIGSPRQVRPVGYDTDAEQERARRSFAAVGGIDWNDGIVTMAFFCQPSDWRHVEKVWNIVLDAAARTGARVLLKPHPEESVSRVRQYLAGVKAIGLEDQVVHLPSADAPTTVALADIVATGYSAAALDAAVRGKPVVCISDGDVRYPVDIPSIVDAPLVRSADELTALLKEFASDPSPLRARAQRLIEREPQFATGPGERLRDLVAMAIGSGRKGVRAESDMPTSLFLDPPHPVFPV